MVWGCKKMKKIFFGVLFLLVFLVGCGDTEPKISGYATANLEKQTIKNGETTQLNVKGFNNGNAPVKVHFEFATDKPEAVKLSYPANLEFVLQPGEDTGNRRVSVQAFTDTIRTDYLIVAKLVDESGKIVYSTNTILSVIK